MTQHTEDYTEKRLNIIFIPKSAPAAQWIARGTSLGSNYLLAPTKEAAKTLAEIFNMEEWAGIVSVYGDPREVDSALGSGRETRAIVAIWWD